MGLLERAELIKPLTYREARSEKIKAVGKMGCKNLVLSQPFICFGRIMHLHDAALQFLVQHVKI